MSSLPYGIWYLVISAPILVSSPIRVQCGIWYLVLPEPMGYLLFSDVLGFVCPIAQTALPSLSKRKIKMMITWNEHSLIEQACIWRQWFICNRSGVPVHKNDTIWHKKTPMEQKRRKKLNMKMILLTIARGHLLNMVMMLLLMMRAIHCSSTICLIPCAIACSKNDQCLKKKNLSYLNQWCTMVVWRA